SSLPRQLCGKYVILTHSNLRHGALQNLWLRDPDQTGFAATPGSNEPAQWLFQKRPCNQSRNRVACCAIRVRFDFRAARARDAGNEYRKVSANIGQIYFEL